MTTSKTRLSKALRAKAKSVQENTDAAREGGAVTGGYIELTSAILNCVNIDAVQTLAKIAPAFTRKKETPFLLSFLAGKGKLAQTALADAARTTSFLAKNQEVYTMAVDNLCRRFGNGLNFAADLVDRAAEHESTTGVCELAIEREVVITPSRIIEKDKEVWVEITQTPEETREFRRLEEGHAKAWRLRSDLEKRPRGGVEAHLAAIKRVTNSIAEQMMKLLDRHAKPVRDRALMSDLEERDGKLYLIVSQEDWEEITAPKDADDLSAAIAALRKEFGGGE